MDSFTEPYTRLGDDVSLQEDRAQVRALEDEHRAHKVPLSGRILHICHDLPVAATLASRAGVISPPATPPTKPNEVLLPNGESDAITAAAVANATDTWVLTPRYGHDAMISGIRSLAATHEQLIIGWTGDIETTTPGERISASLISEAEKAVLEESLKEFHPWEPDPDDGSCCAVTYVPVWLEDKVAHGHYDGYCKQSEFFLSFLLPCLFLFWERSPLTIHSPPAFRQLPFWASFVARLFSNVSPSNGRFRTNV